MFGLFLTPMLVSPSGQGCLTVQLTSFLQRCSGCFIIYAADTFVMNGMVFSLGSRAVCYFNICIKYIAKYCRHVQYLSIGNQSNSSGQKSAKNSEGENPGVNHTLAKKDTKYCCTCFPR